MSARYTLGLLMVVYVVNTIDRQVMNILVEPVRQELELSDAQMGWLVGGAFALFYTLAGLPIARLADRRSRRNIIAVALLVWSAMTVASGLARSFAQLMAARVGVGIGEAGCTPPAHSMLSDTFPPERRATAISLYSLGIPIGTLLGMALGGYLADELGWRTAFFVVGAPGIVLSGVMMTTLREPTRGAFDRAGDADAPSLGESLRFLRGLPAMRHMLAATSLQTLFLAAAVTFQAPFLQRVHGLTLTEAGFQLGLIAGVLGGAAVLLAGVLADRLGRIDLRWHCWLPAIGALSAIPFSALAFTTPDARVAVAGIAAATFGSYMYSGLGHAVMQGLVKPRMRATTSAVALFAMNLVGFGLGPVLLGTISDWLGGEEQIRYALLWLTLTLAWAAFHYGMAARSYREDVLVKDR